MTEKDLKEKFSALHEKMQQIPVVKVTMFSEEAIEEFFRGFDHPVLGILEYIKMNTSFYQVIDCTSSCPLISKVEITDYDSYYSLLSELKKLKPACTLDFTYSLRNGIFPFLKDIQETFSVFFTEEQYEIQYIDSKDEIHSFSKKYMTHITPDEIRDLRSRIAETIIDRVSIQTDSSI